MKKALLALGLSGLLMFSSMPAFAEEMGLAKQGMEHAGKLQGVLQQLNLSDDQQVKIKDLIKDSRHSANELREQLNSNSEQLREAMQGGSVNLDLVKKLADAQGEIMSSLLVKRAELKNQINGILTPEQRDQLSQLVDTAKGEMKKRFGSGAPDKESASSFPSFSE